MASVKKRLNELSQKAEVLPFNEDSKFIIMSDCHRGQGNTGDNFLSNQTLYFGALEYYYENGFTYVELGDGDELWENRTLNKIIEAHSDVFWLMSKFYHKGRFHMIYGNHDIAKKKKMFTSKNFSKYYCEGDKCSLPLFPDIEIPEALILENDKTKRKILLIHGHQGSFLNDTIWPVARFLVRYFWRPLELIGFIAPTGAGRSHTNKEHIEKALSHYANSQQQMLIAGHTHRPAFPEPKKGLYFNDGSCVHPRCITGIEIENNKISLIKWAVCTDRNRSLYVCRDVLEGPVKIDRFFNSNNA